MILCEETQWCRPWEVEEQVPAVWVDRWFALREARNQKPEPGGMPIGQTVTHGNVRRTRVG